MPSPPLSPAFDPLTKVFNRRFLELKLRELFHCATLHNNQFGIVFIDLDGFKPLNDRFGHAFGDMVLQQEAQCLSQQVRQSDVVARYGGDEFCVLVSPVDRLGLKSLGQRLCARINELACRQGTNEGQVGASIGVVCHDPASNWTTPEDFLAAADKAMYLAKSRGKNRVIFLDPISRSQVQPEDEAQVSPKPMYVPVEIYARPTECAK